MFIESLDQKLPAVRSIAWLGFADASAVICISSDLTHYEPNEHTNEHHEHPEACAAGPAKMQGSADSHARDGVSGDEKRLQRIPPPTESHATP